jgi:hypothetical protein
VNRLEVVGLVSLADAFNTCGRHEEAVIDAFHTTEVRRVDNHLLPRLARWIRFDMERRRSEITVIE